MPKSVAGDIGVADGESARDGTGLGSGGIGDCGRELEQNLSTSLPACSLTSSKGSFIVVVDLEFLECAGRRRK